jgi:hypothetical protein
LPRFHCTGNEYEQHQGGGRFCFFLIFLTVLTRGAFYSILDQQNLQLC